MPLALVLLLASAVHVEHYDASLRLAPGKVEGTLRVRVRAVAESRTVTLDAPDLTIHEVRLGGRSLSFTQPEATRVEITLPRPLPAGQSCTLVLRYSGAPKRGLRTFSDQAWTAFNTESWMPSDNRPGERATLRLRVKAPAGWKVITSEHRAPISTFVMGFAAGRFRSYEETYQGVKLRMLATSQTPEELRRLAGLTRPMVDFFVKRGGLPYPTASYTQVLAHGKPMQEVSSFTLLPEEDPDDLWLMSHELSHQWWGIGITCETWSDFWLNEGVATFLANVYLGEQFGPERYQKQMEESRQIWEELKQKGQDRPLHFTGWKTPRQAGGSLPYHKGAWVLHLLRQEMGEEAFWRGFRDYTREFWGRSVTSSDFQQAMEKAAGRSLAEFFRKWVYA